MLLKIRPCMQKVADLRSSGLAVACESVHSKDRRRGILCGTDIRGCRAPLQEALLQAVSETWRISAHSGVAGQSLQKRQGERISQAA